MTNPDLKVYIIKVDLDALSKATGLDKEILSKIHKDGRNTSKWCEYWSSLIFHMRIAETDRKDSDIGEKYKIRGSVKSLTKKNTSVRFSRNTGCGRSCSREDVKKAIKSVQFFVFADISNFPIIRFIEVSSAQLMEWFMKADSPITKNGTICRSKFFFNLGEPHNEITGLSEVKIEEVMVDMATGEDLPNMPLPKNHIPIESLLGRTKPKPPEQKKFGDAK